MKILVWEGQTCIKDEIGGLLPLERLVAAQNYQDFMAQVQNGNFDCIVASLANHDGTAGSLVEHIKKFQKSAGLILISDQSNLDEKIASLRAGADDFVSKPFELTELAARIYALVRRVRAMAHSELSYGEIRISLDGKMVFINERELSLTRKELELLLYFIEHKNSVVSKENLVSYLSGNSQDAAGNMDILYAHVKNLKKKLARAGCSPYLKTIYGIGYKWDAA